MTWSAGGSPALEFELQLAAAAENAIAARAPFIRDIRDIRG
jgi:hypothetical protein